MITTILKLGSAIFKNNRLILFGIIGILIFSNYKTFNLLRESNYQNNINKNNIDALANNFGENFETIKLDNGKLLNRIDALTVSSKTLSSLNSNLNQRLKDLNLKINRLESVTDIGINTNIALDTIKTLLSTSTSIKQIPNHLNSYDLIKNDEYFNLKAKIHLFKNDSLTPIITDFNFITNDSLIVAPEIKYRRPWYYLWLIKKPTGMKLNVNSSSPHSKINYIKHYNFKDLRNK